MINSNLNKNTFKTSFEIVPPKYYINPNYIKKIVRYHKSFDFLDITCCPLANLRISPISIAHKLILEGINPKKLIINFSTRDKNTLSLQSEILGCISMNIKKILIVKGDKIKNGDSLKSKEVYEVGTNELIKILDKIRNGNDYSGNKIQKKLDFDIISTIDINKDFGEIKKIINNRLKKGSNVFITQPVYSHENLDFISQISRKKNYKILCGILPITNKKILKNIVNKIAGIPIDNKHLNKLKKLDDYEMEQYSIEHSSRLIKEYKSNLDGIHLMTSGDIKRANKIIKDL